MSKKQTQDQGMSLQKKFYLNIFFRASEIHNNFIILQQKLSKSISLKNGQMIRIKQSNFNEVLQSLAVNILKKNESCKNLLKSILNFINKMDNKFLEVIPSIIIKIEYKKDTIDLLTPIKVIKKEISRELNNKSHPLHKIIFEIWYQYIENKYLNYHLQPSHQLKIQFYKDLSIFSQFIANVIYHLYRPWFYYLQSKIQIYRYLQKIFVPHLLNSHPQWVKNYKILLVCFGEKYLKINRQIQLRQFQIDHKFIDPEAQNPFTRTINIIQDLYNHHQTKIKIKKLRQLAQTLKQQIFIAQKKLIKHQKLKQYHQIDVDNSVGCFAYCILKSHRDGIAESLDYLQIFFKDENSEGSQYLQDLGIGHVMATLKSAALYLRQYASKFHSEKII